VETSTTTLVYDGDCGMCRSSADWLRTRAREGELILVASESLDDGELAALGLTRLMCEAALCSSDSDGTAHGARAVAAGLSKAHRGWPLLGRVLRLPVFDEIGDFFYGVVARNWRRSARDVDQPVDDSSNG
jgi:predicted DCC family thiol-disulfide oxidoreductase YuxK